MGRTYLLDTHVLIWLLGHPERVSATTRQNLADPDNVVMVSAVSAWEIATKQRIGKLDGLADLLSGWSRVLSELGAVDLSVASEHALLAGSLSWDHRDPFDRLLVAQTQLEGAALVTNDRAITRGSTARVVW